VFNASETKISKEALGYEAQLLLAKLSSIM
jgi:hypothetical protein